MPYTLIYGARGALGAALLPSFPHTIGIDLSPTQATHSITTPSLPAIRAQLNSILNGEKLDNIICVAGGWVGGGVEDLKEKGDVAWGQSGVTSLQAAELAGEYLKEGGMLILTGAYAALKGTPGMIAYGMSKAAVHHLVKSLAMEGSGMPKDSKVLAILPITLDTPMNRKNMPNADTSTWTPLNELASQIASWTKGTDITSGSLIAIKTTGGKTSYDLV